MNRLIITLAIFLLGYSNEPIQTRFSSIQLKDDMDFLFQKLEYIHPNLYAYTSKDETYQLISNVKSQLTDSLTSVDFWMMVSPIVTNLKHGHTSITPKNEDVDQYINKLKSNNSRYIPFSIIIEDSNIFIRDIYSNAINIKPGQRIISINGIKSPEIIEKLIQYENGERTEYRIHYAEKRFMGNFSLLYPNSKYIIRYISNGKEYTEVLDGINEKEAENYFSKAFPLMDNYKLKLIDKNIAYIEYNACVNYYDFKIFLDSTFTLLKQNNIKDLIIDIRKNGGGDTRLNTLLLTYLTDKSFYEYSKHIEKLTFDIRASNKYYSQYRNDTVIERSTYFDINSSNPLLFSGNVYLLTGIETFSSGTDLAMLIKDYKLGTIIGQETGGLPTCYGDVFSFELPNTRIDVCVSYKWSLRPSGIDDNKGVIPDIILNPSIADIISNKDIEMEYTLKQIKGQN
jgi:C-terminal processing protease CtpA/Prc